MEIRRATRPEDYARAALVLALEGDDPIGVVGVRVRDDGRAELKRMYVRPRRRARGSGTALLTEAIAAAQDLGCAEVVLDTDRVHMAAAFALYRRFGFRTIPPLDAWAAPTATGMVLELRALALSRAA